MSSTMDAIADDTRAYVALCEYYGERPVVDEYGINPYSLHARKLKARKRAEEEAKSQPNEKVSRKKKPK